MNMDHLISFAQNQWYVVVIALVALFLIVKFVKAVVKWVIILAIIAGILVYGANYKDTLAAIKDTVVEKAETAVTKEIKDRAINAIKSEAKDAKYTKNADGSYTIESKTVRLDGKPGSSEVKVTVAGQSFNLKVDDVIQAFIDQAKQN